MDPTLFLVLFAIALLIVVAFVARRRYHSRRALVRQVRELQALAKPAAPLPKRAWMPTSCAT